MTLTKPTTCPTCGQPYQQGYGPALREAREASGLSLRKVAGMIGVSPPYLSDIERGNRKCPDKVLRFYKHGLPKGDTDGHQEA